MTTKKAPNGALHGLLSWVKHSSNWGLLFGVVLGIVALCFPDWAGREDLREICNQLAILLPGIFAVMGVGQKIADGMSKGKTSAYTRHAELEDKADEAEEEERLRILESMTDEPEEEDD